MEKKAFKTENKLAEAMKKAFEAKKARVEERKKRQAVEKQAKEFAIKAMEALKAFEDFSSAKVEFATFAYVEGMKRC